MSKTRLTLAVALVLAALPLAAQTAADGAGVAVDLGSAQVLHRTAITYPGAAVAKGVEGTVVAQVTLDAAGNVSDARVVNGPDELRKAVLQAVLQWHFTRDSANATRQVSVTFQAPSPAGQPVLSGVLSSVPLGVTGGVSGGVGGVAVMGAPVGGGPIGGVITRSTPLTLKSINVYGLPDQAKAELLASLPVREGETFTPEALARAATAARQYDEHLNVSIMNLSAGEVALSISTPGANVPRPALLPAPTGYVSTGGSPTATLVRKVQPGYPPLAMQARIQGVVKLKAIIAKDGSVQNVTVVSAHPLLAQAAIDAVKQWVYQPTLVNGQPVEVSTQIDINFALADEPPAQQ